MGSVIVELSMSLDGYSAGSNDAVDNPLGDNGERLHEWMFEGGAEENAIAAKVFEDVGAVIIGRRMFNLGIEHWGPDGAFGKPVFVLTHRPESALVRGKTTFNFVSDGIESALRQAKATAGDSDVLIGGGAEVAQQYLRAGLVDELRIHIAPFLLGRGKRLFDDIGGELVALEQIESIKTPLATHVTYRVKSG